MAVIVNACDVVKAAQASHEILQYLKYQYRMKYCSYGDVAPVAERSKCAYSMMLVAVQE